MPLDDRPGRQSSRELPTNLSGLPTGGRGESCCAAAQVLKFILTRTLHSKCTRTHNTHGGGGCHIFLKKKKEEKKGEKTILRCTHYCVRIFKVNETD